MELFTFHTRISLIPRNLVLTFPYLRHSGCNSVRSLKILDTEVKPGKRAILGWSKKFHFLRMVFLFSQFFVTQKARMNTNANNRLQFGTEK